MANVQNESLHVLGKKKNKRMLWRDKANKTSLLLAANSSCFAGVEGEASRESTTTHPFFKGKMTWYVRNSLVRILFPLPNEVPCPVLKESNLSAAFQPR